MQINKVYSDINRPMNIVVFGSGSGTNFNYIYKRQKELEKQNELNFARVSLVFSNNPKSLLLENANNLGIHSTYLSSKDFFSKLNLSPDNEGYREKYDQKVIKLIENILTPDLIVLAGYRRRLSQMFFDRYKNRVINLYPGDITKNYLVKGKDACIQALENRENSIKATIYIDNNAKERFGHSIAQSQKISLKEFNTNQKESMNIKIREEGEWKLYPFVIHDLIANGRVSIDSDNKIYVDNKIMNSKGYQL